MSRIAWGKLMQLGLRDLGLAPDAFWRLTPAELMLLCGVDAAQGHALRRAGLEALIRAYPDNPRKGGSDGGS